MYGNQYRLMPTDHNTVLGNSYTKSGQSEGNYCRNK